MAEAAVILEAFGADARLAELGLTRDQLWEAILVGEAKRDGVTANHPKTAGGFYAWSEAVAHLREILLPQGWTRLDVSNLPLVVSPDGETAILVTGGTSETGTQFTPQTTHDKGRVTMQVVAANRQSSLFPELTPSGDTPAGLTPKMTWVVLVFRQGDILRAELSLPSGLNSQKHIASWKERIHLGERDLSTPNLPSASAPSGPVIDVPVTPKNR